MLRAMRHIAIVLLGLACACSSKKDEPAASGSAAPAAGSGSAGSGAAAGSAGSGAAAGSAGSGAAAGSAGSDAAAGSGSSAGAASGEPAPPAFDFDKLNHQAKLDFMRKKVMPPMKRAFQEFDAKKFAGFNCKTCHGKDPRATKYKMPNPELPKLDFAALKAGKHPKMAEFMNKVVKPEMAKLLQQPEYTEANPKGFGCLECHEVKK